MESMPVVDPDKYRKELLSHSIELKKQSCQLISKLAGEPCYSKRGRQWLEEATSKLNKALSIDPRDTGALYNMGCIEMIIALWDGDSDKGRAILQATKDKVAEIKEELKKESLSRKNEGQVKGLVLMNAPSKDANTQLQHPQLQQKQQKQPLMQISQQQPQMRGQYQMQFPSSMGTLQFESWQFPSGPGQYQFEGQYPMQPGVGQQFSATQGTPNPQMVMSIGNPGNLIPIQQQQQREQHHHGPQGAFCNFVPGNSWSYDTANYRRHGGAAANPGYLIPIQQQQQQQQQYGSQGASDNFVPRNPWIYDNANHGQLGGVGMVTLQFWLFELFKLENDREEDMSSTNNTSNEESAIEKKWITYTRKKKGTENTNSEERKEREGGSNAIEASIELEREREGKNRALGLNQLQTEREEEAFGEKNVSPWISSNIHGRSSSHVSFNDPILSRGNLTCTELLDQTSHLGQNLLLGFESTPDTGPKGPNS